jgi:DNA-binding CsgD family transcriptional regulator
MVELLRVLGEADSLQPACQRVLGQLAGVLAQPCGALWAPRGDHLVVAATWCAAALDCEGLESALRSKRVARGVGFAGSAWERRAAVDRRSGERPIELAPRDRLDAGITETIAFPCTRDQEVLAIVALYGSAPVELGARLSDALQSTGRILGPLFARRRGELGSCPLSRRELEVLTLAGQGHSVREIAQALTISPATAKSHLEHIYRKLGVRDRTAAVAAGLRCGYID